MGVIISGFLSTRAQEYIMAPNNINVYIIELHELLDVSHSMSRISPGLDKISID